MSQFDRLEDSARYQGNIDLAKWGDRQATEAEVARAVDLSRADRPIAIAIDAQEIGRMFADRYSPYAFNQYLLERFKAAGAPVEGVIKMKLVYGAIARMKTQLGDMQFTYLWLSPEYVAGIAEYAQANGLEGR